MPLPRLFLGVALAGVLAGCQAGGPAPAPPAAVAAAGPLSAAELRRLQAWSEPQLRRFVADMRLLADLAAIADAAPAPAARRLQQAGKPGGSVASADDLLAGAVQGGAGATVPAAAEAAVERRRTARLASGAARDAALRQAIAAALAAGGRVAGPDGRVGRHLATTLAPPDVPGASPGALWLGRAHDGQGRAYWGLARHTYEAAGLSARLEAAIAGQPDGGERWVLTATYTEAGATPLQADFRLEATNPAAGGLTAPPPAMSYLALTGFRDRNPNEAVRLDLTPRGDAHLDGLAAGAPKGSPDFAAAFAIEAP